MNAAMSTEDTSPRFSELDQWPTREVVLTMMESHLGAAATVQSQVENIATAAAVAMGRLRSGTGRLIYVGAGTSGRLGVLDGVELGPTYDWPGERVAYLLAGGSEAMLSSVEGAEDDALAGEQAMSKLDPCAADVAIGLAASGRTPFTVAALQAAQRSGALTIGIACNAGTPLLTEAAHPILLATGAEVVAGSTRMKAGTAQKIALNLLTTAIMVRLGRVYKGRMVSMRATNRKLKARAVSMVSELAEVPEEVAAAALGRAGDDVKLALLIAAGASAEQGAALLKAAGGDTRTAMGNWSGPPETQP